MKLNKKIAALTTVAILGVAAVGTTLALFSDRGEANNIITMGNVGIELTEPIFSEATDNENYISGVVPNQIIEKDPTITVLDDSKDAYIRAKIEFVGLTEEQMTELEQNINIQDGWEKESDGYYYYKTSQLTAGESVVLFDEVLIPETWGNEIASAEFEINIIAEAIQADNFTPSEVGGEYGWFYSDDTPVSAENYNNSPV